LAELLRRAFGDQIPRDDAMTRFPDLLEHDYGEAGSATAAPTGGMDESGAVSWRIQRGSSGFTHSRCRGQLLRRLGVAPRDAEGRTLEQLFPPAAVGQLQRCYERAWSGEAFSLEVELPELGMTVLFQFQPVCGADSKVREVVVTGIERLGRSNGHPLLESV